MSDVNTIPPPDAPAAPAEAPTSAGGTDGGLSAAKLAILQARLRGKQVQAPRPPGGSGPAAPIVPRAPGEEVPLSFSQERLWFLDRLQPGLTAYNMPGGLRLTGALDPAALERALGEIVRRHEILRTTFQGTADAPVQVIAPFAGLVLPVEDLSGRERAEAEAAVRRRVADEAALPFDLAAGPLFRPLLLRLGEQEHVLLLAMHHVVTDAWSGHLFLREVATLYEAFRTGQPSPLPELPVQYGDFALWQRRTVQGEMLERQVEYWKRQLAGAPAALDLPADHPRPAVASYRGASVPAYARPEVLERLRGVARSEGATLFMVLLAAFQALLGRYAGTEDVVVGSPVAGRGRAEVEGLLGMFVNTLVLRTDLSGDPEFRELLRRVRETTLGALGHQDVPFERLVLELQTERSMSRSPLFQVSFQLEDLEESTPAGGVARAMESGRGGMRVQAVVADIAAAKFDLTLSLQTHLRGITGTLAYATDLFEASTARGMTAHLERVLQQVAADPNRRLSQLELMDEAERARVVEDWNRTDASFPDGSCIHELIEAQAERTPHATAVVFEDDSLTYRTLNARANRLAHDLVRRRVGPETRVGVCMERGLDMVVTLLAVLKAGGAYVPMDPGLPPERLAYMLADSAVSLLLTQEVLRRRLPAAAGVKLLTMDGAASDGGVDDDFAENPRGRATPDGLAYVIYTSGSTGRPKGVMNAHRGVVNRLCWMQAEYGIGADDVVLQKTPFSFDVSVWEFFWPLQQGACLVMARPDGHRDPAYLQETIERRGVTTLHFVPSMLQPFVEAADADRCASLQRVICSGEALPAALVGRFHARFPEHVALHNLYGPTEAAVDVSHWACGREDAGATVPIGRPVWNTRLYVLDA
ncbi:MAG TPA: condensation domain-containing protein, partial [Longimicrobium sp.]|nr:condensation domain-containing protein [Longimicrobium sp.]